MPGVTIPAFRRSHPSKFWFRRLLLPLALAAVAGLPAKDKEDKEEKVEIKIVLQDGADLGAPFKDLLTGKGSEASEVWFFDTAKLDWFGRPGQQVILRARAGQPSEPADTTVKLRSGGGPLPAEWQTWKPTDPTEDKRKLELDQDYSGDVPKAAKESLSVNHKLAESEVRAVAEATKKPAAGQMPNIRGLFTPAQRELLNKAAGRTFCWDGLRMLGSAAVTEWELSSSDLSLPAATPIKDVAVERWLFGDVRLTEISAKVRKSEADVAGPQLRAAVKAKGLPVAAGNEAEAKTKRFLDFFGKAAP